MNEVIDFIINNKDICNKYCSIECSSEITIQKAIEWQKENPDIALKQKKNAIEKANEYHKLHPNIRKNNLKKAHQANKEKGYPGLKAMLKWQEEHSDLDFLNEANKRLKILRDSDSDWVNKQNKILIKNLEKANIAKRDRIIKHLSNLNINIENNFINVNNIFELCKNDICGSYVIKGKVKYYKNTPKENKIFNLLACKSNSIYKEIRWILRVLSQPEKQDKNAEWTIAKWWYIANLYYDFEFVLLTDPNGVSEEEALLVEAKYSIDNGIMVEFDSNHTPQIDFEIKNGKHGYWSL